MLRLLKVILCAVILFLFPFSQQSSASVPYITYTLSADGDLIPTQTAYEPLGYLFQYIEFNSIEDIFIDDKGYIYVVDAGTKTVYISDQSGSNIREFGKGILEMPTGVFVDREGDIYIADYKKEKVFRFSNEGQLKQDYGKPDSPLFGSKSPFKPQKVSVDLRGNVYVIGEGSTNGIIQLNTHGEFLGYFGVNRTEVSLIGLIRDFFASEEQKSRLFMRIPPAPTNIALDQQGLIYTVTKGTDYEVIKKLNVAGQNLLDPAILDEPSLVDITVDHNGNIFVIDASGFIYEFDSFGNLLFVFGGKDDSTSRLGLFKQPSGIAVDQQGNIYIADKELGMVQVFEPTEFSHLVHQGIALYKEGLYVESQQYWKAVLDLNSSFGLAHTAMGKAYFKQQDYESALKEYKLAKNIVGYSDAFWEVRYEWMLNHLETIFVIGFLLFVIISILKFLDKKKNIFRSSRNNFKKLTEIKFISDLLFLFRFIKHPIDSFYDLKWNGKGSVLSATILYFLLFVFYLIFRFQTGFIFSTNRSGDTNLLMEFATINIPILSFIIVNYLVSTINDGEGKFRHLYIGTIYALAPYLIFILPTTFLSLIITLNEAFIYEFSMLIIYSWCFIILFIMIKEIHNFSILETIKNVLTTLFGMVILWLVVFIIIVLMDQVYDFVYSIIKEVLLRV